MCMKGTDETVACVETHLPIQGFIAWVYSHIICMQQPLVLLPYCPELFVELHDAAIQSLVHWCKHV